MADPVILLSGVESLAGKEFREAFGESGLKNSLIPVAVGGGVSALLSGEESDEGVEVIAGLDAELAARAAAVVVAGPSEEILASLEELGTRLPVIDLTGSLCGRPGALLRDPEFEAKVPQAEVHVVPHPAAFLLARLLAAANETAPVVRTVATVLEPASQSGSAAINELQKQTIALLSFQKLPQEIFDAQLAFAVLARTGEKSKISIAERQSRIERDVAGLLALHGAGIPTPSVRLVQAPVFHGYGVSVWMELQQRVPLEQLGSGLERAGVDVFPDDPPANTTVVGQAGISVGAMEADPANANAFWLWAAVDNLRMPTALAMELLREML